MTATDRVHSPTPEELMAYLDGESAADLRAAVQVHLAGCAECQAVVADLRGVSRQMNRWNVEEAPATVLPRTPRIPRPFIPRPFSWRPSYLLLACGGVAAALLLVVNLVTYAKRARVVEERKVGEAADRISVTNGPVDGVLDRNGPTIRDAYGTVAGAPPGAASAAKTPSESAAASLQSSTVAETVTVPRQPSVIRTATLRLVATDFNAARASVESIVAQAGGFLDQITVNGSTGTARTLTGSLRVPAARLGDALTRLRQLGQVTEDTQGSEDVSDQVVDLDARLANARATEQRLHDILKNRTGKLSDVLQVEQELSRVRLEIEQMDAQRVNMGRRVTYATITVEIDEERKAGLESGPLSLTTRVRVAAADGLEAALETLVGTVLFILRAGPALLLWIAAGAFGWTVARRIFRLKAEATRTRS